MFSVHPSLISTIIMNIMSGENAENHVQSSTLLPSLISTIPRNIMAGENVGTMFTPLEIEGTSVEVLAQNAR